MCLKRNANTQVRIDIKHELQIWFLSFLTIKSKRGKTLSKSGFQSFLQLHPKVSYRGLYIKGTLWYGKQCPCQYHWTNMVKMFYMVTLSSLFRWRYQIKILPSEIDIAMGCFCNTHHFYTEGFLHMD